MNPQPIGVFDSGVGGLSALREIRALLPHEDLLYVADSAYVPYGDKPAGFVAARSTAITRFLIERGAKAIVVACNTATAAAITALRSRFRLPIIGMEPAVKPAVGETRTGRVGVLATGTTLASDKFAGLLARFGAGKDVYVQPCPGLVECVERGALADAATQALLEKYLAPLVQRGVDTIVLGCTHYPFLRPAIAQVVGPRVAIVDPNSAVARELYRRLEQERLRSRTDRPGTERFWTSAEPERVGPIIAQLWGRRVDIMRLPELE